MIQAAFREGHHAEAAWIILTTFYQSVVSGDSSCVAAYSQYRRCSTLIPDGPPDLF